MSTINIYATTPNREHKAAEECRQARIRAYLPGSKLAKRSFGRARAPLTPGYVYAEGKPLEAKHMRSLKTKGNTSVSRSEVAKLYAHCRVRQIVRHENPFSAGDTAIRSMHGADITVRVVETRGRTCIIAYEMLGKTHQQAIAYAQLRPG